MVSRPFVQVEIFHEPKFFADHFLRYEGEVWTASPSAGASLQEDTVILTVQAGEASQSLYKNFSQFSTVTYPYLVGRVTAIAATNYEVYIQRADNSQWVLAKSGTTTGRFQVDLRGIYTGNIKGVAIYCIGSPGDTATFDYIIISGELFFPSEKDITQQLTVIRSLINNRVNNAEMNLANFTDEGDTYLNISENSKLIIWISRNEAELGTTAAKVFGGKLASKTEERYEYNVATVKLEAHGHASELFDSPELVYKLYAAENGRTIIEEAVALCNYLAKYPHGVGWFDEGGPYGSTDDRIGSAHDAEDDEVKPFTVIKEMLNKAANPAGTVGFDMYETPSGTLVGHLRESADWTCPVTPTLRHAIKTTDAHIVKNKQKVYGATGKIIPSDEVWTESLAGWVIDEGDLSLVTMPLPKKGTYSLYATYIGNVLQFRRDISAQIFGFGKRKSNLLEFWRMRNQPGGAGATVGQVELWAPDEDNKFVTGLKLFWTEIGWRLFSLSLGPDSVYIEDENDNGIWTPVGSPNWADLHWLCFRAENDSAVGLLIDWLRFSGMPFSAEAEDTDSIAKYGTKEADPVVDQNLLSNAECVARTKGILEKIQNALVTLEPITVDGDYRYKPGDILSSDGDSFRITEVKHILQQANWDTELTVSEA